MALGTRGRPEGTGTVVPLARGWRAAGGQGAAPPLTFGWPEERGGRGGTARAPRPPPTHGLGLALAPAWPQGAGSLVGFGSPSPTPWHELPMTQVPHGMGAPWHRWPMAQVTHGTGSPWHGFPMAQVAHGTGGPWHGYHLPKELPMPRLSPCPHRAGTCCPRLEGLRLAPGPSPLPLGRARPGGAHPAWGGHPGPGGSLRHRCGVTAG